MIEGRRAENNHARLHSFQLLLWLSCYLSLHISTITFISSRRRWQRHPTKKRQQETELSWAESQEEVVKEKRKHPIIFFSFFLQEIEHWLYRTNRVRREESEWWWLYCSIRQRKKRKRAVPSRELIITPSSSFYISNNIGTEDGAIK